jgi:hypothetical protein
VKNILIGSLVVLPILFLASKVQAQTSTTYCSGLGLGNFACTNYDTSASAQSYCTKTGDNLSCTTYYSDGGYGNSSQVRAQQNYLAGQVGTELTNAIASAIERYKAHKQAQRAQRENMNQRIQDVLASVESSCTTGSTIASSPNEVIECRNTLFTLDRFLHRHRDDFVPNVHNLQMLFDYVLKHHSDEEAATEEWYESAFLAVKHDLNKKVEWQ